MRIARIFHYLRSRWPWWNRTADAGQARHVLLLPGDHGPGDTGYDRPIYPHKWSPTDSDAAQDRRNHVWNGSHAAEIRRLWGAGWEALNPASPGRLVLFLLYSGWADQLTSQRGHCLNCFTHGLDVRLPSYAAHTCGPLCGLPRRRTAECPECGLGRKGRVAALGRLVAAPSPTAARNCSLHWAGRGSVGSNPARRTLLQLVDAPGMCIHDTGRSGVNAVDIPSAMRTSRFCFSPRGWDNGDSDRYLPALLHGCIPVLSDPLEAMPLQERGGAAAARGGGVSSQLRREQELRDEWRWEEAALAVDVARIPKLPQVLGSLGPGAEAALRAAGEAAREHRLPPRPPRALLTPRGVSRRASACSTPRSPSTAARPPPATPRGRGPLPRPTTTRDRCGRRGCGSRPRAGRSGGGGRARTSARTGLATPSRG